MIRLRYIFVGLIVAVLSVSAVPVSAHELEANNGVSAVLHISPDDNPVSGSETLMYFDFTSQQLGFDIRYSNAKISYQSSEDRQNTASILSADNSATSGYATTTFAKPGVYNLTVSGFTDSGLDKRFTLDYRIRVTAGQNGANKRVVGSQIILLGLTAAVIVGIVASEMIRRGTRYKHKK